jgi:hypothetical protein
MFEFPLTLTVQQYSVAVDSDMNVNALPAAASTVSLLCDFQLKSPGAILQDFGLETTGGGVLYAQTADRAKIIPGSTFTYQSRTFVIKTLENSRADGYGLDYIKALAVMLNG